MPLLKTLVRGMSEAPGYTLMRGAARFQAVRTAIAAGRQALHAARLPGALQAREAEIDRSVFRDLDRERFVQALHSEGAAFGLHLPPDMVDAILGYARQTPCYADRDAGKGFALEQREQAEQCLGKPILLAQYFNAAQGCPAVARLERDPLLHWIAGRYLGSVPTLVGVNLWWTFPVDATDEDRDLHAQLFHRDVDDFRFFKFFFYLTDVEPGDGAHVCVLGSHQRPPARSFADRWVIRRYSDGEVQAAYPAEAIREICGPAGTGFAENTLCIHKGQTPVRAPRLLLQIQFALFDYGTMHDRREADQLALLPL
ncbi:hypothetical protein [Ramlibacter sp. 2FC]|uniref:hypothetical protein n=1 Tax=Ramlibacter sp. 2FC TaxID=2502188 RepID=UPI0010F8C8CA|nr:hypothetical protein [Ramlibacter sp. 2FC]